MHSVLRNFENEKITSEAVTGKYHSYATANEVGYDQTCFCCMKSTDHGWKECSVPKVRLYGQDCRVAQHHMKGSPLCSKGTDHFFKIQMLV